MERSPLARVKDFNRIYSLTLSKKIKHEFLSLIKGEKSKNEVEVVEEQLEQATREIIYLYYEMETEILRNGFLPFEIGQRLKILKAIIFLCRKMLSLPYAGEIIFPKEFIEEYTGLLQKTNKAVEQVGNRINKLSKIDGTNSLKLVLEKNLLTLTMLQAHYIISLGVG